MSPSQPQNASNVRRLRPVRVLVAGDDPRFLAVATIILSRAGFLVESTSRLHDIVAIVDRERPNAVVLDATGSVVATARAVAAIERRFAAVKVVVVSEAPAAAPAPFAAFEKWDSFPQIVAEIERAFGHGGRDRSAAGF